jgi:Tfp pilus assembly protein PilO
MKPLQINASQFDTKSKRLTLITVAILLVSTVGMFGIFSTTSWYLKKNKSLKSQRLTFQQADIASKKLQTLARDKIDQIEGINNIFPNNENILDTIQNIETILTQFDPNSSVRIPNPNPTKNGTQLIIPLSLRFRSSVDQAMLVLSDIEQLPNVIEITSLDLKTAQGASNAAELAVSANVYVQDPFTQ